MREKYRGMIKVPANKQERNLGTKTHIQTLRLFFTSTDGNKRTPQINTPRRENKNHHKFYYSSTLRFQSLQYHINKKETKGPRLPFKLGNIQIGNFPDYNPLYKNRKALIIYWGNNKNPKLFWAPTCGLQIYLESILPGLEITHPQVL